MSAADCERWENRLLDLTYSEIEESDEREVRAHLDGCEHCRKSLEKLGRGRALARHFEQVEPPADAMQAVLRAARDKALEIEATRAAAARAKAEAEANAATAKPIEPTPAEKSWWSVVLGIVMAPQFAMATLLLLTVGVGLWWFPEGHGSGTGTPPLLSEPSTVAVGPEALTPAEPLHFDVDPRTGRVEAHHGDEIAAAEEVRPRGIHVPTAEERAANREVSAVAAVNGDALDELDDSLRLDDGESAGVIVDGVLPDVTADGPTELGVAISPTTPAPRTAPTESPLRPLAPTTTPAPRSGATERTGPSVALEAEGVEAPTVGGPPMMAAGLLHQARELVTAHRDRDAIAQYEALLTRYRTAPEAPQAMIEVAACYRRIGAISRARGWLERASAYPAVAAEARRELLRLDAPPPSMDSEASMPAATGE